MILSALIFKPTKRQEEGEDRFLIGQNSIGTKCSEAPLDPSTRTPQWETLSFLTMDSPACQLPPGAL